MIQEFKRNKDEELKSITRECKRLQSSLKDVMASNRILRDMNKALNTEIEEKHSKMDDLMVQLKQSKERNERIKATAAKSDEKYEVPEIQKSSKSTQTALENGISDGTITEIITTMLSLYLKLPSADQKCFKAISASFSIFQRYCSINLEANSLFLQFLHRNIENFSNSDRYQISKSLYMQLPKLSLTAHSQDSIIVFILHHLIPISSIMQENILESLLSRLLEFVTNYNPAKSIFMEFGYNQTLELLSNSSNSETIGNLCSSLLLSVVSESNLNLCRGI